MEFANSWKFAQDSVRWMSSAAGCTVRKDHARAGRDPEARLRLYTNCTRVGRHFKIAFYKLNGMGHKIPSAFWFDAALGFWTHLRGPGVQDAMKVAALLNDSARQVLVTMLDRR